MAFSNSTVARWTIFLQRRDAERPLLPVRLGNITATRWLRPIAAAVDAGVQVRQLGCQTVAIIPPRQPVHPRGRIPLELEVGPAQQVDIEVVEQSGQLLLWPFSCRLPYAVQPGGHARPARCPVRVG